MKMQLGTLDIVDCTRHLLNMALQFHPYALDAAASAVRRNDMSIFEIFRKREITEEIFSRHYIHPGLL